MSRTAENLLVRAGTAALAGLSTHLKNGPLEKQLAAIRVLRKFDTTALDLSNELLSLLSQPEIEVAKHVAMLFNALGPEAHAYTDALTAANTNVTDRALKEHIQLAILNTSRTQGTAVIHSFLKGYSTVQLLNILATSQNPKDRTDAAKALRSRSQDTQATAIAGALKQAVEDQDVAVRAEAAKSLAFFDGQARHIIPILLDWLNSDEAMLQNAALTVFATLPGKNPTILMAVIDYIKSTDWTKDSKTRKRVGHVLRVQGPDAGQWLADVFTDEDATIRERAGLALAEMGPAGLIALPTLLKIADEDESDEVAQAALQAVAAFGPAADHATEMLIKLCYHASAVRRMATGWALAGIGIKDINNDRYRIVDTLMINLLDTDERVARSAHIALTKLGRPTLPKLRDALRVGKGEAPYWALRVMARLRADPEVVIPRMLRLTLPGMLPIERGVAAELLGNYAPEHIEMIPILVTVLGDRESYVVHAAERTLRLFGDRCTAELFKALKSPNKRLRLRALALLEELK